MLLPAPRIHATTASTRTVDPRLREVVAMALCWAEWPGDHTKLREGPEEYWRTLTPEARARYYDDAESFARAMMGEGLFLVPFKPTQPMVDAARAVRPALRADRHVHDVWRAMLENRREAPRPQGAAA